MTIKHKQCRTREADLSLIDISNHTIESFDRVYSKTIFKHYLVDDVYEITLYYDHNTDHLTAQQLFEFRLNASMSLKKRIEASDQRRAALTDEEREREDVASMLFFSSMMKDTAIIEMYQMTRAELIEKARSLNIED